MAVIVPAALGTVELGYGIYKEAHAAKQAKKLRESRPTYKIPTAANDESLLAKSELANGIGSEAERAYENDLDRGFSTSINAIERLGGGVNNIAQTYDASAEGRARLAQMKEGLRLNQINNVINASRNMQEQQDKQFQINEYAPWADETQANAGARQGAANMIASGASTIVSAFGSKAGQDKLNSYFKGSGSGGDVKAYNFNPTATAAASSGNSSSGFDSSGASPSFTSLDVSGTSDDNYFGTIPNNYGE